MKNKFLKISIVIFFVLIMGFAQRNFSVVRNYAESDSTVTDYDGNVYHFITIGSQVWLKENLKSLHYSDGSVITGVMSYNNSDSLSGIYGRLYNWNAAMKNSTSPGVQGVAPNGFHIPTDSEWTVLGNFLGGNDVAGGKLKETDTAHWYSPNTGATNSSAFTALGGGEWESGNFQFIKMSGVFWSSTQVSSTWALYRYLLYNSNALSPYTWYKTLYYSVRCIKNTPAQINLLNGPNDLVFDKRHNRILVGNWAGSNIVAIDSNGNQSIFKWLVPNCDGMELYGDTLYTASINKIYCINLNSSDTIKTISVSGSSHLGPITLDTVSMNIYVSDWGVNKIFKVNLLNNTSSVLVGSGVVDTPMGLLIDRNNNRILMLGYGNNVPIRAINLNSGSVSTVKSTNFNDLDAITRDKYGNVYISSYSSGNVYKYDSSFINPPVLISSGNAGPSGFGYSYDDNKLGVTNFDSNRIKIIDLNSVSIHRINSTVCNFELKQNYPNPFNCTTRITFSLKNPSIANIRIYDVSGKEICCILNQKLNNGSYYLNFNASNLSSGIYYLALRTDNFTKSIKMLLIK